MSDSEFPAQQQQPPGSTKEMRPQPHDSMEHYQGRGLLAHRKALITGGDSGIGRAVAVAFAKEGAGKRSSTRAGLDAVDPTNSGV